MEETSNLHHPVLLNEVVDNLAIKPDGIYLDATFGRGGHSQSILNQLGQSGRLLAMDKDPEAVQYARQYFAHDKRFTIQHGSFAGLADFLKSQNLFGNINGVLFDLGVSSPQLDNPLRGFSFSRGGKLDMRMDTSTGLDAATWVNKVSEKELARVLWEYGEERCSRRIAHNIVKTRVQNPITTTQQLAEVVAAAIPNWPKDKHPATRSFQAIRIFINKELEDLEQGLNQSMEALVGGGRLLVISFHSLEDRIVKQFMQQHERGDYFPKKFPVKQASLQSKLKRIGRAIKPSLAEIDRNPRSRSAVLRIAEKLS